MKTMKLTNQTPVLVTGGAGYIGAHVCKALARAGYLPICIDNLSTGHVEAVRWGPLVVANVGDAAAVARLVDEHRPVAAMHFAAFSQVAESVKHPEKYFENNVGAAASLVKTLMAEGVESLVFSSTAAVYGLAEQPLIPEGAPTVPINPYGSSKLAFETLLGWLGSAGRMRSVILRYFNAAGADPEGEIGERHEPETHLIPLVCEAALGRREPITVFGTDYPTPDGSAVRDYIHVCDLADAHVLALQWLLKGQDSRVWNVGTGSGHSVKEVLSAGSRVLGAPVPHTIGGRRPGDPASLVADSTAIRRELSWRPSRSLDDMIASAGEWAGRAYTG